MKFVWESGDVTLGRVAHCASGTYLVVGITVNGIPDSTEETRVLLVDVEHNTVERIMLSSGMSLFDTATYLTSLEAWPDGVDRDGRVRLRESVSGG